MENWFEGYKRTIRKFKDKKNYVLTFNMLEGILRLLDTCEKQLEDKTATDILLNAVVDKNPLMLSAMTVTKAALDLLSITKADFLEGLKKVPYDERLLNLMIEDAPEIMKKTHVYKYATQGFSKRAEEGFVEMLDFFRLHQAKFIFSLSAPQNTLLH